jgi:AAA15 family ATPase/GTPase
MWVSKLHLKNVKSFADSGEISFAKTINLFIGGNNSGKSTLLKCLYRLQFVEQDHRIYLERTRRKGANSFQFDVELSEAHFGVFPVDEKLFSKPDWKPLLRFTEKDEGQGSKLILSSRKEIPYRPHTIQNQEPKNFIYPYFSKRKAIEFHEHVGTQYSNAIQDNLNNLYAKIDRLTNPGFPAYEEYTNACRKVLGFLVSCSPSSGGKQAGLTINETDHIPLREMGEGTVNMLGLIVDLCVAKEKVFLVEEIENDIHPKALKGLLELIIEKSKTNQFIISTHSNIVAKYLGSQPDTKLFAVSMQLENKLPTSTVTLVKNAPESRLKLLEDLGYDLLDFELWKGYLLLEESSAEKVIRDILIPYFCPKLRNVLKTIAASGISDVEPRFSDFLRLFVFIHTAQTYKDKAWVRVDGGVSGEQIIQKLQSKFPLWNSKHFRTFQEEHFELYYPKKFQAKVKGVLQMPHGPAKQGCKTKLLKEVIEWAEADPERGKAAFSKSAAEVIEMLREIESELLTVK